MRAIACSRKSRRLSARTSIPSGGAPSALRKEDFTRSSFLFSGISQRRFTAAEAMADRLTSFAAAHFRAFEICEFVSARPCVFFNSRIGFMGAFDLFFIGETNLIGQIDEIRKFSIAYVDSF